MSLICILEAEELACAVTGIDYDEIDGDTATIEEKLMENFGIGLEAFQEIASRLIHMIDVGESPLTRKRYKGFSKIEEGIWISKIEIPARQSVAS